MGNYKNERGKTNSKSKSNSLPLTKQTQKLQQIKTQPTQPERRLKSVVEVVLHPCSKNS